MRFDGDVIRLDGEDVAAALRHEAVGKAASRVAVFPRVRTALVSRQRAFRKAAWPGRRGPGHGDGHLPGRRPQGLLTASAEERARRRYNQLIEKGNSVTIDGLLRDIRERDARDSARAAAPLRRAVDAIDLDTTAMTIDAAIAFVLEQYRARVAAATAVIAREADAPRTRRLDATGRLRGRIATCPEGGFINEPAVAPAAAEDF